uniref:G-protein coupled receptors family 1 profile domain-containing protein n=1 Tax=Scleropages formosus TaxID=113540 RepID=A0A8C9TF63_SCLFO
MDNTTFALNILQLEGVDLAPQFVYPVFFILLVTYILTMITNTGLIILIAVERSLHQPMYLLFCNLSFNDIMGNTNILPRIMMDLFSTEKYIGYVECVTQAFCSHIFAAAAHVILMIMAFDRYVAICNPLRYSSIMTTSMVVKLSASAWCSTLIMVTILLSLTLRLTRCRSFVMNVYCDNASLFKLSCQDVSINNTYGLAYTVFISGSSLVITIGTYLKIFTICFTKKSKELNSKALQTCSTHLVLYMIMLWSGFFSIIFHRIQIYSGYRKLMSILFHVVPANLNPIIYALQTKELKSKVKKLFHSKSPSLITFE